MKATSVLFVCMGNICRSPTGEAVLRQKAKEQNLPVHIDSAGTIAHHVGEPPDKRTRSTAEAHGYDFTGQSARQLTINDFTTFDYLFAMDSDNLANMMAMCPSEHEHKVRSLLSLLDDDDFAESNLLPTTDVPDPYYGGQQGFKLVLQLVELACDKFLQNLQKP